MKIEAQSVQEYLENLPEERKEPIEKLRKIISENLPNGFEEQLSYGMIGYVVPKSIYPKGYHCTPELPLPFLSIASQKNSINLYHMGIYADEKLLNWFQEEFPKYSKKKLDMGKSCMRFKKPEDIPYGLIGKLARKMTPQDWIEKYENAFVKK
jgi:uncharacterized protein YdhG (YjbR/CyaY superfamily)